MFHGGRLTGSTGAAGVAAALRDGTRAEHEALELALDWETRAADRGTYRAWLERLFGFHRAWEPAVAAAIDDAAFTGARGRMDLLADDLERLGLTAAARGVLPAPREPFRYKNAAAALGSMYVLEGSTLGGQLIARHVRATLGFEPRYHAAYGRRTAAMWREFQLRLAADVRPSGEAAAVAAARETFARLGDWLTSDAATAHR